MGSTWGRTSSGGPEEIAVPREVRESLWLQEVRCGHRIAEIAAREGLSKRRVQAGVSRAREREEGLPRWDSRMRRVLRKRDQAEGTSGVPWDPECPPILIPLFPIAAFTPASTCPHHGPIPAGSPFCCMVCSRSGLDAHPALKRDPRTDPKPEPRPAAAPGPRATRKQKRHAARLAALGARMRRAG